MGAIYDVVSLEALLYRRPRARLAELFGPMPGATVVDVGCGTGLNLAWLRDAVAPGGRVVGVDANPGMLRQARRRTSRHGWSDVTLVDGDVADLVALLRPAITPDAYVSTFVLSLLPDGRGFWDAVDSSASSGCVVVAMAELGRPDAASRLARPALAALTTLGGGDPDRQPWQQLAARAPGMVHETLLGGHVHLGLGTFGAGAPV